MSEDAPKLEFVAELKVTVGPIVEIGKMKSGVRRMVPITGGTFSGPRMSGKVLPGGEDWQVLEDDGLTLVDARYVLETADGVRVEVRNRGVREASPTVMARIMAGEQVDPSEYYFRTTPSFEVEVGPYGWLRRAVFVGWGERKRDLVVVKVWRVG